ncbi:DDE_Tnp_IS1595 domain-containing protein [Nephila pilipes]|uniref:DDE_Tnp_IS1595 domain-containing protein n=1 Tax=Nephila pilipes TaxID=299642 RepID=A0A8X6U1F8_NEPPI|nr:DDE_Tnp_IS1595 domain-containing protein [Nephila pilipes]
MKAIRHGSWFTCSKLKLGEISMLTMQIILGSVTSEIGQTYHFSSAALADGCQFINELILDYIENNSEKIGSTGRIVEVDKSKFRKRKYHRGQPVEGQRVFGGMERGSGKVILVAVHDRSRETLVSTIQEWIEPGTTIYSDCWKAFESLGQEGYNHLTVNHNLHFVDPVINCHTNSTGGTWRNVKTTLPHYNRQADFQFYLALYLFRKSCDSKGVDHFNQFQEIIRDIDWEKKKPTQK